MEKIFLLRKEQLWLSHFENTSMEKLFKMLSAAICMAIPAFVSAQTTVIQDTRGESALDMGIKGVVAVNAKDESLSFSWSKLLLDTTAENRSRLTHLSYIGISVQGKGKSGISSVLKDGDFQYDGSLGGFYTYSMLPTDNSNLGYIQLNFAASYLFSQFKLYDGSAAYADQVYSKNQSGYKLSVNGNWQPESTKIPFVLGLTFNGGQKNNTADLTAADISDYTLSTDPLTGKQRIVEQDKKSAYNLSEFRKDVAYFNFNLDAGPQLFKQFLLLAHSRWSAQEGRKPQWNPAMGLYFTKKGAPLEAVAGLQVQTLDYFNTAGSTKSRQDRTVLNLVAGFSF